MSDATIDRNAFEALCELAASEHWCWRVSCSTCGHVYFRYGFRELASGGHPGSEAWQTRERQHHELERLLGPAPPLSCWPVSEQEALISVFSSASIDRIASSVKFPEWLAYLGLALWHTQEVERRHRVLTRSWVPQLLARMKPGAGSLALLIAILKSRTRPLKWDDLGTIEGDIRPEGLHG